MAALGAFSGDDSVATGAAVGGMGLMMGAGGLAMLIGLGFLLWVGLTPGEPGANKYGEPPVTDPITAS